MKYGVQCISLQPMNISDTVSDWWLWCKVASQRTIRQRIWRFVKHMLHRHAKN